MERMIYEQQVKKVDLSFSVVDSHEHEIREKIKFDAPMMPPVRNETCLLPYSGFLQPPPEDDNQLTIDTVNTEIAEDDDVLASCLEHLGHWLIGVQRVHEP